MEMGGLTLHFLRGEEVGSYQTTQTSHDRIPICSPSNRGGVEREASLFPCAISNVQQTHPPKLPRKSWSSFPWMKSSLVSGYVLWMRLPLGV